MSAAGFQYVGDGDKTRCKDCQLEISDWTSEMNPFETHSQQRPDCPFVCYMKASSLVSTSISLPVKVTVQHPTGTTEEENPAKRQKMEPINLKLFSTTLLETHSLQQVRRRTFSHWSDRMIPSSVQMILAGFFNCNVGDRVICIYCNLICQQWNSQDDPWEVHQTLSPNCQFIRNNAATRSQTTLMIDNRNSKRYNSIIPINPRESRYAEISNRVVNHMGANHNPMIEHAGWFPHCGYARQLCGEELYRKIQETKKAQTECARIDGLNGGESHATTSTNVAKNRQQLIIPDESTLSRLVAARLDWPISQCLLDQNFKLSIIKRCWEDQLRIKHDDFVSEYDLYIACLILQKQIEHIDGKKENIVVPSIKMKQIREQNALKRKKSDGLSNPSVSQNEGETEAINAGYRTQQSTPVNLCMLCLTEEKQLACIPCGHLTTCVACGLSLRWCPVCRKQIEAFVRIYI